MKIAKNGWELIEVFISLWKVRDCVFGVWRAVVEALFFFFEADLHQIIKSGQVLSSEHIQYFVYQILRGMPSTEIIAFDTSKLTTSS